MKKTLGLLLSTLLFSFMVKANNVQINNVFATINGSNVVMHFDLSWENSWRTASTNNWDGAWVFFKYKDTDGRWKPVRFTGSNVIAPAGYNVDISNNGSVTGIGAFVYRNSLGFGAVNLTNIRAGVQTLPGTFDVKGFAVEMVFVPQGSFYVGDGTGVVLNNDVSTYKSGNTSAAYLVAGNGSTINLGNNTGQLSGFSEQSLSGNLAGFPSGFAAFWMMKYELSAGAYRDFLNMLTYTQQLRRFNASAPPNSPRGTKVTGLYSFIEINLPGIPNTSPALVGCDAAANNSYDGPSNGEWTAMSAVRWSDAAAYLDWAGLRPMTELEYEKACRGPVAAVPGEYAWGTPDVAGNPYTFANRKTIIETVTNPSTSEGNALLLGTGDGSASTTRGGVFATATSTKITAGAGYYGTMELSGNVEEFCVTTWNRAGRSYTGKQGNGVINNNGEADENFWPGINNNNDPTIDNAAYTSVGVTGTAGIIARGAGLGTTRKVSWRELPEIVANELYRYGIRGVRESF